MALQPVASLSESSSPSSAFVPFEFLAVSRVRFADQLSAPENEEISTAERKKKKKKNCESHPTNHGTRYGARWTTRGLRRSDWRLIGTLVRRPAGCIVRIAAVPGSPSTRRFVPFAPEGPGRPSTTRGYARRQKFRAAAAVFFFASRSSLRRSRSSIVIMHQDDDTDPRAIMGASCIDCGSICSSRGVDLRGSIRRRTDNVSREIAKYILM